MMHDPADIPAGSHGCILYDTLDQLLEVTLSFLRHGLLRNERCLCLGPPETIAALEAGLADRGVDIADEYRRGALILTSERAHLVAGRFDPDVMLEGLRQAAAQAVTDGFSGLRATGDMLWELGPHADFQILNRYEAALDMMLAEHPITGLCQYRRCDYPPELLNDAFKSHDAVVLDTQIISPNPFHQPPELLLADDGARRAVEWISSSLRQQATLQREMRETLTRESHGRLIRVLEGMSDSFIGLSPDWRITYANAEAVRVCALPADDLIGTRLWDLYPEDKHPEFAARLKQAAREQVTMRFEHFKVVNGVGKWLEVDANPSLDGLNVFYRDITARKETEHRQELLMREVDHRAKNALAVAQNVVMLTQAKTVEDFVTAVTGRISALARVHTLLAKCKWSGAELHAIAKAELEPYHAAAPQRVVLDGPALTIEADAAQPVAMVLHELATNAARYGALSVPEGKVTLSWRHQPDGGLRLDWREQGGPTVEEPMSLGFGARMISVTASGHFAGKADFHWRSEGLHCTVTVAPGQLTRMSAPSGGEGGRAQPARDQVALTDRRVLVVEDDTLLAMGLRMVLETLGCEVVGPASTLEEGLILAASERLDVAVLDVNLRGRPSWTVADVLQARGVPYLFATGYGESCSEAAARGAKVLAKPFPPEQLAPALRQVLANG